MTGDLPAEAPSPAPWSQGLAEPVRAPWLGRAAAAAEGPVAALLMPLSAAEDALSRLDALAGAAGPAVQAGLAARMALAEAAGWLAVEDLWVHPRDLALREAGLTGSTAAAAQGERLASVLLSTLREADAAPVETPADAAIEQALSLARGLGHLATLQMVDPMESAEAFGWAMAPLGAARWPLAAAGPVPEFAEWRSAFLKAGEAEPALLAAANAARHWAREAGEADAARPSTPQALMVAAIVAKRRKRLRHVPLPFWAAFGGRSGVRRPAVHAPDWPVVFLMQLAEGARRGLAELERLNAAAAKAEALAAKERSHGQAGKAAEIALRQPVVTAAGLAAALGATPQGALLIIKRLMAAGILREATGRASFRAFVI